MRATRESVDVVEPVLALARRAYAESVVGEPTQRELEECLRSFRRRFPTLAEQVAHARAPESVRHLGVRPLKVEMDLTSQCNLRCVMCYFADERFSRRPRVDLSVEQFERIAEQVFPYSSRVSLSIGTEPLLNRGLGDMLEIVRRFEIPWSYMSTNAQLLRPEIVERMIETRFSSISVSIDAATAPTYERIRKGGRYDRLISNLRDLAERKRRHGVTWPVLNLNYVLMRSNLEEFPDFVDLARDLGAGGIAAMHVTPFEGLDMQHESLERDQERCNQVLDVAEARAESAGIPISLPPRFEVAPAREAAPIAEDVPIGFALNVDETRRDERCPFPWHFVGIDPYGNVLPCGWWYRERPMGNVHERPFQEIWHGEGWRELRAEHRRRALRQTCLDCPAAGMGHVDHPSSFKEVALGDSPPVPNRPV